jgi:methionyl-tRNA formyltransferase
MDAGPIISQIQIPLTGEEKATDLMPKAFALGTQAVLDILPSIFDGTVLKTDQDDSLATPADKLTKGDGLVRFDVLTARQIHNRCRAYAEWPGTHAFFLVGAEASTPSRIKIVTTTVIRDAEDGSASPLRADPRALLAVRVNGLDMLSVQCADGSELGISHLQVAMRKAMPVRDFLNGIKGDRVVRWVDAPLEERQ